MDIMKILVLTIVFFCSVLAGCSANSIKPESAISFARLEPTHNWMASSYGCVVPWSAETNVVAIQFSVPSTGGVQFDLMTEAPKRGEGRTTLNFEGPVVIGLLNNNVMFEIMDSNGRIMRQIGAHLDSEGNRVVGENGRESRLSGQFSEVRENIAPNGYRLAAAYSSGVVLDKDELYTIRITRLAGAQLPGGWNSSIGIRMFNLLSYMKTRPW